MKIYTILYHSLDGGIPTARHMTVIHGLPFYQSSGNNSGNLLAHTWFPFFGIQEQTDSKNPRGWLIKPRTALLLPEMIRQKIDEIFSKNSAVNVEELKIRFGSVAAMLLSSRLGGGLWDKPEGQELKSFLVASYPNFYSEWEEPITLENLKEFNAEGLEGANQWLIAQAQVPQLRRLMGKLTSCTVEYLCAQKGNGVLPLFHLSIQQNEVSLPVVNKRLVAIAAGSPTPRLN